jgi:hypothetical protein
MTIKIYPLRTIRPNPGFGPAWEVTEGDRAIAAFHEKADAVRLCEGDIKPSDAKAINAAWEARQPSDSTIEDRIAGRIARIADAKDQVVRTLVSDLKASIREAEAGGRPANPLERRAVEVLERLIAPGAIVFQRPAAMGKTEAALDWSGLDEGPVTLDDPRFAAHPIAQANAASWPKPKRTRRPTRAQKIAASEVQKGR